MSKSFRFVKVVLVWLNVITLCSGLIFIAIPFYVYNNEKSYKAMFSSALPVLCMFSGVFTLLLSLLALFGICLYSRRVLKIFFCSIGFLVFIEFIVGIVAFANQNRVDSMLEKSWRFAYEHDTSAILSTETWFSCCGFTNTTDNAVPDDCQNHFNYSQGCLAVVKGSVSRNFFVIGGGGLFFSFIQLFSLILTIYYCYKIPTEKLDEETEALIDQAKRVADAATEQKVSQDKERNPMLSLKKNLQVKQD